MMAMRRARRIRDSDGATNWTRTRRQLAMVVAIVGVSGCGVTMFQREAAPRVYQDPAGRFSLTYPGRNWGVVPGTGSTLVTLAAADGGRSIQVEYQRLNRPLEVRESADLIIEFETDAIRQRQPGASDVQAAPMRPDMPEVVVIDFARPGAGGAERVRQFSFVRTQDLFRLSCLSPAADFVQFQPICEAVVRSLRTNAPPRLEPR